jgi:hypothetical protein
MPTRLATAVFLVFSLFAALPALARGPAYGWTAPGRIVQIEMYPGDGTEQRPDVAVVTLSSNPGRWGILLNAQTGRDMLAQLVQARVNGLDVAIWGPNFESSSGDVEASDHYSYYYRQGERWDQAYLAVRRLSAVQLR